MHAIELSPQSRADAIASLKRYFEENLESLGDLPAGLLLNYILEEIGPAIYNKAIHDAQARITQRVADLDGELYADEFQSLAAQGRQEEIQTLGREDRSLIFAASVPRLVSRPREELQFMAHEPRPTVCHARLWPGPPSPTDSKQWDDHSPI